MPIKTTLFRLALVLWMVILLLGGGCENKQAQPQQPKPTPVKKEAQKPRFEFKEEIYGDPEIFSTPRIQFAWRAPGLRSKEIWSMRLDGSDLRRVVKADLLYSEKATGVGHGPVRSPDNRYIVISMFTEDTIQKHLIDLKTKTKTIIMTGGYKPHFSWTPDSKRVVFYSDPGLLEYNIETKELKKLKDFDAYGHYILEDGRFLVVTEKGVSFFTPEQKFIKAIDIFEPGEIDEHQSRVGFYHRVSWDGNFMVYRLNHITRYIRLDDPKNVIFSTKERYFSGGFDIGGKSFYFSVFRLDLVTGKEERLLDWPCIDHDCGGAPTNTTLYNLRAAK